MEIEEAEGGFLWEGRRATFVAAVITKSESHFESNTLVAPSCNVALLGHLNLIRYKPPSVILLGH